MIPYDPNKPLISIHIPKTGGVSLRSILKLWFDQKLLFHYFNEERRQMPVRHLFAPGICIHGHFNSKRQFGVEQYYPEAKQFITFLRDPFEILVSRYFFVKQQQKHNKAYRDGLKLTLPDNVNQYLENEIVNKDYHPNILDFFPQQLTLDNFKNRINKQFIYIGVMEDFPGSINKLADSIGFSRPVIPKENISERLEQVDYSLKDLFEKKHPLENEIYQYVLSIQ